MSGVRSSVRLPRRMVPICSERADRFREPLPDGEDAGDGSCADGTKTDEQDAKLALGRSDLNRCRHGEKLYHLRLMFSFRGKTNPYMLMTGMTGVKLGDRMLQVGCSDGGALAAVAAKVGLSGRALAVVPDIATAARAQKGAQRQGVLVDVEVAPPTKLPADDTDFDLVVLDDAAGQFASLDIGTQSAVVHEAVRVLKPGGRVLVVSALPAEGLAALLGRGAKGPAYDATPTLAAGGCRFVRLLGEREGLRFVEGTKARA